MKILFLTQVLPFPLTGGPKIRAYYMIRWLAQNHDVTLISFVRKDDPPEAADELRKICAEVITVPMKRSVIQDASALVESILTGQPVVVIRDRISAMRDVLTRLMVERDYDVIHADQTSMAEHALFAQSITRKESRPKTILDEHNALYLVVRRQAGYEKGLRRIIWQREAKLLEKYEAALCRQFSQVITVTEEDRDALLSLYSQAESARVGRRMTTVPICVDPSETEMLKYPDKGQQIIHLGTMFWPPNVEGVLWFSENVLPLIREEIPDVSFVVAGKDPPPNVQALSSTDSPTFGYVEVTGFVSDPTGYLESSKVFIVPVWAGGGMRVKILNGWLWGLPIVSTLIGAEGIKMSPGKNILLADNAEDFASEVISVLRDKALAEGLRKSGRSWVEEQYDWRKVYSGVDEIYQRLGESTGVKRS